MTDTVFPHPRIYQKLYALVKQDFPKYLQAGYADTPHNTGAGLETEVVRLLEQYAEVYNYRIHFTDPDWRVGFSGLIHKFDAGIEERDDDLNQCLFEVKYRGAETLIQQSNKKIL